jgi:uncharacterized membrane protein
MEKNGAMQTWLKRIVVLSVVGVVMSLVLLKEHYDDERPLCDLTSTISCSIVNKSEYAVFFQTPVALLGLSWNVALAVASVLALQLSKSSEPSDRPLLSCYSLFMFSWCLAGVGFVGYLIYAEVVLGAICPFCTVVHVVTLLCVYGSWQVHVAATREAPASLLSLRHAMRHAAVWAIFFALVFGVPLLYFNLSAVEAEEDALLADDIDLVAFGQCVARRHIVMYGSMSCSHCQHQKALFADGFRELNFVECNEHCAQEFNISQYPTWVAYSIEKPFVELDRRTGVLPLRDIALFSQCELVQ